MTYVITCSNILSGYFRPFLIDFVHFLKWVSIDCLRFMLVSLPTCSPDLVILSWKAVFEQHTLNTSLHLCHDLRFSYFLICLSKIFYFVKMECPVKFLYTPHTIKKIFQLLVENTIFKRFHSRHSYMEKVDFKSFGWNTSKQDQREIEKHIFVLFICLWHDTGLFPTSKKRVYTVVGEASVSPKLERLYWEAPRFSYHYPVRNLSWDLRWLWWDDWENLR